MNSKQQTALQELISEFEELKKTKLYQTSFKAIDDCILLAYNKVAMEKEQMGLCFLAGDDSELQDVTFEQYYRETYENSKD